MTLSPVAKTYLHPLLTGARQTLLFENGLADATPQPPYQGAIKPEQQVPDKGFRVGLC